MPALTSELLRTGLALKLHQIKLATRSYLRDRADQATSSLSSYAIAGGLFAAAGLFVIVACLVGTMALFRWIEMRYGPFPAFGAIGALLVLIAIILAGSAAMLLKRGTPHFPSLGSRLRVAVKANPVGRKDNLADASQATFRARSVSKPPDLGGLPKSDGHLRGIGLVLVASLLGWAATRRRQQAAAIAFPKARRLHKDEHTHS